MFWKRNTSRRPLQLRAAPCTSSSVFWHWNYFSSHHHHRHPSDYYGNSNTTWRSFSAWLVHRCLCNMYTLVLESSKFGWKKNGCSFRWFFKEQRTYWYWLLPWCLCSSFTFWSKRQRTWGATKIDHHENEKRCCVCLHLARKKWPIKYWSISSPS